ncbi:dynamin-related protein DRPB [Besnoitia besnoiti]|uniref:Dynamin-related protein DRPB n=1 Tax=Besnoitia besnoiti TaxID=94643 RepID=A0A2A9M972_BESBE|nr:dynamin-related protein DRPB [Besnoitia besnoiti]PFH31932.1 dynamin-related protein DRPB [Besnoitia besnoiti]
MDGKREDVLARMAPGAGAALVAEGGKGAANGVKVESQMYQQLRKLINVVDELRDVGLQQFIQLPRICVVGTQSAGKSSVLEAIVGLDFLPRGDGVVTRRPLELRLVHLSEAEHDLNEAYAVFENDKETKIRDFQKVRQEIDRLTDQVAGKNKGIIDSPIVLTIYATQCPDLSLIDLPGITRVPLKGSDQSEDIEMLTRQMALRYAADPRTIILAVIPANVDMSTSDALQMARRVDPRGVRTIGVITKIDLMDRGTDAAKMLTGEEIPLRLGYTGVRNRSQADIREGKSVRECLEEEKTYFATHPTYRLLPPHLLGVHSLVDKLTKVLFRHIKNFLPEIKKEIAGKTRVVLDRLQELGDGVPMEASERAQLLWTAITDYVEIFKNTIRGKYDKRLQMYFDHQKDITGGSQIRTIFNELLEEFNDRKVTEDISDYEIDVAIRLHEGDSLPGFPSPDTFEYLILPYLKRIQAPVMECLDRVSQTLELLSQKIANRVFGRFPALAEKVLELSQEILIREREHTKVILQQIVDAETGYLFTNDAKYLAEHGSMISQEAQETGAGAFGAQSAAQGPVQLYGADGRPVQLGPDGKPIPPPTHAERAQQMLSSMQQSVSTMWSQSSRDKRKTVYSEQFIREIRRRLDSYFALVLRNVRDAVPKTIGFFLVRQLQEKLQFEIYNQLNDEKQFNELLGEPPHIMEERRALMSQLQTLKRASAVLQRDPTIAALNLDNVDETFDRDLRDLQRDASSRALPNLQAFTPQHGTPAAPHREAVNGFTQGPSVQRPNASSGSPPGSGAHGHDAGGGFSSGSAALVAAGSLPDKARSLAASAVFGEQKAGAASAAKHVFEKVKFQAANNPLFSD